MNIKFNSLERIDRPVFTLCNPGSTYSDGTLTNTIGSIPNITDEEFVFNFNATSELNFVAHKVPRDITEEDAYVKSLFSKIENKRMIFAEDIGYFVITNVKKSTSGKNETKEVQAMSCEIELERKQVNFIEDGTYVFIDLLEKIIEILPKWSIGDLGGSVPGRVRTFSDIDVDKNVLAFLLEDIQDAYECIITFDIINRRINVYDQEYYVVKTDIHITNSDVVNSLEIDENDEDVYTAIRVFGDNDLTISGVNPLGTNVIYDFSYYLDWMSDGLRDSVVEWSTLVDNSFNEYYDLNSQYYSKRAEEESLNFDLERLNIVIDLYKKCRENIVAEGNTGRVKSYNETISAYDGAAISIADDITATLNGIDALIDERSAEVSNIKDSLFRLDAELAGLNIDIDRIRKRVSIQDYFSASEYDELFDYISEGTYTDEFITVTDGMSQMDILEQMRLLYDRALSSLKRMSSPLQKFSIDTENFLFVKEFKQWSDQLETGCLINVELEEGDVAELFLATITVNFYDRKLDLTFGNRYNKFDPKSLFNDVLGDVKKSANTLDYVKDVIYPIANGQFNEMQETLANSRTLAKNAALSSENEDVVIDDTGYTGRQILEDGNFDPRQVKITGRTIVFTDDGWQTSKVAIGEIIFDEETQMYGINAQAIIGDLVLGNNLTIKNNDGTDLLTAVDNKISAGMSSYVSADNFGDALLKFNSSIEADAQAISQYYSFQSEFNEIVSQLNAYVKTGLIGGSESEPIYGVKIGQEDDSGSFSSMFTPEEIAFYDGGDKVAFLSNKKLNIGVVRTTAIELTNSLEDGASGDWKVDISKGFSIKWIGSST